MVRLVLFNLLLHHGVLQGPESAIRQSLGSDLVHKWLRLCFFLRLPAILGLRGGALLQWWGRLDNWTEMILMKS